MIPFSKVMAELVSIGANLTQALTQRFHRLKMQDRIDRLDAGKPGLQRLSRALRAAERVYPLTAAAAQAACSASDQCGPASSGSALSQRQWGRPHRVFAVNDSFESSATCRARNGMPFPALYASMRPRRVSLIAVLEEKLRRAVTLVPTRTIESTPGSPAGAQFTLRASPLLWSSPHPLQLVDHPLDHAQAALPERRVAGIEAERFQQLGMVPGAAGLEHGEVALCKAVMSLFVDRIQRVHQAVAERVGVNIERRMDEVADIDPEGLIAGLEGDGGPQALALDLQPDLAQPVRRQFAVAALAVNRALEGIEGDLPDYRIDHVLDVRRQHRLAFLCVRGGGEEAAEGQHLAEHARGFGKRERSRRHQGAIRRRQDLMHAVAKLVRERHHVPRLALVTDENEGMR